jgi:protein-disulfide isomerase
MKFTVLAAFAVFLVPAVAQDSVLESIDTSGFSAAQKHALASLLQSEICTCGCNWSIAKCRAEDPKCSFSRALLNLIVKDLKAGKSEKAIVAELKERASTPPPVLDDPVALNIQGDPVQGPANAKITIVEFSDFQCPYCAQAAEQARMILQRHPSDVRLVFKQFPLDNHSQAELAAEAALAAHSQGKFWPMHDKLYANFRTINRDNIMLWAGELGLDMKKFTGDLSTGKYRQAVENEEKQGDLAGVQGTPTFFFNGRRYSGAFQAELIESLLVSEFKLPAGH